MTPSVGAAYWEIVGLQGRKMIATMLLVLLVAPLAAASAASLASCMDCPDPASTHHAKPCQWVTPLPCCDESATLIRSGTSSPEAPTLGLVDWLLTPRRVDVPMLGSLENAAELARLTSPLRLSVVSRV